MFYICSLHGVQSWTEDDDMRNVWGVTTTYKEICKSEHNNSIEMNINNKQIGLSGVRALPFAAGINVVAIVLGIIFLLLLRSLLFYQKEDRWGFAILHGLLSNKNIRIPINNKHRGPPLPPAL
jgi:hypothetical protein